MCAGKGRRRVRMYACVSAGVHMCTLTRVRVCISVRVQAWDVTWQCVTVNGFHHPALLSQLQIALLHKPLPLAGALTLTCLLLSLAFALFLSLTLISSIQLQQACANEIRDLQFHSSSPNAGNLATCLTSASASSPAAVSVSPVQAGKELLRKALSILSLDMK